MTNAWIGLVLALALGGCGGDSNVTETGGASGETPSEPAPAKFTEADFNDLSTTEVPGWKLRNGRATDRWAQLNLQREKPAAPGLEIQAAVRITTVDDPEMGFSLDPTNRMNAIWIKQTRDMRAKAGGNDAVVAMDAVTLAGDRTALSTYVASHVSRTDDQGRTMTENVLTMRVRFHDRANAIRMIITTFGEKKVGSTSELQALLTKDAALEAARSIFDAFTDRFGK